MNILCTHHKGGVGKTELAIHIAHILRKRGIDRTLLIDCDSQASAWRFYFKEAPDRKIEPRHVDPQLALLWNPDRVSVRKLAAEQNYDNVVIDVDAPLANTVQTILQSDLDLILIPVNLDPEAIVLLGDPIRICATLERTLGYQLSVCIVPLGVYPADIQDELDKIETKPSKLKIAKPVPNLQSETRLGHGSQRLHPG